MSYHFSKTVSMAFPAAVEKVTAELTAHGFGILQIGDRRQDFIDCLFQHGKSTQVGVQLQP